MPDTAQLVIDKVLDSFGQLDILVCNVGSGRSVSLVPSHMTSGFVFLSKTFGPLQISYKLLRRPYSKVRAVLFAFHHLWPRGYTGCTCDLFLSQGRFKRLCTWHSSPFWAAWSSDQRHITWKYFV